MSRLEAALPQLAMVEDEADFRECAIDYLHMSGYSAWGAGCGEDFYRRLLVDPVDILILDVGLPGESGFEIASHLRSSRPDIGIIILSARDQVGDRLRLPRGERLPRFGGGGHRKLPSKVRSCRAKSRHPKARTTDGHLDFARRERGWRCSSVS